MTAIAPPVVHRTVVRGRTRWDVRSWAVIAGVTSGAVMVGVADRAGLWGDEAFTVEMVRRPWADLVRDLGHIDYNMSLHYLAARAWVSVVGFSPVHVRLLSVVFALATLPLVHRLVARLHGPTTAAVAVAVLAFNPFFGRVAVTARPYAMLMCWTAAAALLLLRALERDDLRSWRTYGLVGAIGIHVHLLAVVVVATHGVYALWRRRRLGRGPVEAALVFAVLGLVPTAVFLAPTNTLGWIPPFTVGGAIGTVIRASGGPFAAALLAVPVVCGVVAAAHDTNRERWFLPAMLVGPVAVFALALPLQSLWIDVYFSIATVALAGTAAVGIAWLTASRGRGVAAVLAFVAAPVLVATFAASPTVQWEGWRELPDVMSRQVRPGDAVGFPNAYYRIAAEAYAADRATGPFPPGEPTLPGAPWGTLTPYQLDRIKRTGAQASAAAVLREVRGHDRVWLVGPVDDGLTRRAAETLARAGYSRARVVTVHGTAATLYSRRPVDSPSGLAVAAAVTRSPNR